MLDEVEDFMRDMGPRNRDRYLLSFGWPDGKLHAVEPVRWPYGMIFRGNWKAWVEAVAGFEPTSRLAVLPFLFLAASIRAYPMPEMEDLVLFFCADRSVVLTPQAARNYTKEG